MAMWPSETRDSNITRDALGERLKAWFKLLDIITSKVGWGWGLSEGSMWVSRGEGHWLSGYVWWGLAEG